MAHAMSDNQAFHGFVHSNAPDAIRFFTQNNNATLNSTGTKNVVLIYPKSDSMLNNPIKLNQAIIKSPLQQYIQNDQILIRTNKRKNIIVIEIVNETESRSIISELLKIEKIGIWEVDSRLPNQDTSRSGVIGPVSEDVDPQELVDVIKPWETNLTLTGSEGSSPKVLGVQRLKRRDGNEWKDSTSLRIIFQGDSLPEGIFIFQSSYRVRPYVGPPLQCYNCQRPGHTAGGCTANPRCLLCAGEHNRKDCSVSPSEFKCANCGGAHRANSNECSFYKVAKKIEKVRATKNESYPQAKRRVLNNLNGQRSATSELQNSSSNIENPAAAHTGYRDALAGIRSSPQTSQRNIQTQSEDISGFRRDDQFFHELKICLLEILDVLIPEKKGEQNDKTVEQAIQKSFLRNKKSDQKTTRKVPSQEKEDRNTETANQSQGQNDDVILSESDSGESHFTEEGEEGSQGGKRKNVSGASPGASPGKTKKKRRKKRY